MDAVRPGYQAPRGDNDNSLAEPENTYRRITLQKKSGRQTDRPTDRQMETGDPFLRTIGVMKGGENVKVPDGLHYNTS